MGHFAYPEDDTIKASPLFKRTHLAGRAFEQQRLVRLYLHSSSKPRLLRSADALIQAAGADILKGHRASARINLGKAARILVGAKMDRHADELVNLAEDVEKELQ